ncbi:MAG: PilW family protein [Desulfococcaceae bacterium]
MRKNMRNSKGFTLLELMIVAGIFMVVLIPVLAVFTSSYESYLVQDDISATQQNVRSALMYLRRDIRMAGAGLGDNFVVFDFLDDDDDGVFNETITVYGISARNGVTENDYESDEIIIRFVNLDENLCGEVGEPDLCSDLPVLNLSSPTNVSDDLNEAPFSNWNNNCDCGPDSWTQSGTFFLPAVITSPPDDDGTVFKNLMIVTDVDQSEGTISYDNVQFNYRGSNFTVPNTVANANEFGSMSTIEFFNMEAFQRIRYFIGGDNDDILMREVNGDNAQPLAEGIEDLQFDYFGDFDGDGDEEWYNENYNFGGDGNFMDEEDQTRVRMVRIRMIARTSGEYRDLHPSEKPVLDEFAGADVVSDNFRRRIIVQDVQVRSLGL